MKYLKFQKVSRFQVPFLLNRLCQWNTKYEIYSPNFSSHVFSFKLYDLIKFEKKNNIRT